jgi:protein phosphatase
MVDFSGETHPGAVLDHNEDSIGWSIPTMLWLIADGMGGHASGEVASRVVKETVIRRSKAGEEDLKTLFMAAHEAVLQAAAQDSVRDGMGSTLVVARLRNSTCQVAWSGDSRAYLWRIGELRRITRDHSLLEELIEAGQLDAAAARHDPRQRVLRQAVGVITPDPGLVELPVVAGDWILLCSDGLHDSLSDDEIADVLRSATAPNDATRALVRAAVEHRAEDNVSVVVVCC